MQAPSPCSDAAMPPPPPPSSHPRRKAGPQEASPLLPLPPPPPQQPALRCPRCDSANTKFCYYNNYSLSQPRHFCKTCRRYWTKGGSLRNIPIGGASRKSKKSSRPSSSSSSSAADQIGGLKLFHGSISPGPSMADYPPNISLSSPFGDLSLNPFTGAATGLNFDNFSLASGLMSGGGLIVSSGAGATNGGGGGGQVASSIESLSAHNLELHWKMQQQRMAMLYGGVGGSGGGGDCDNDNNYQKPDQGEGEGEGGTAVVTSFVGVGPAMTSAHVERPQPIFFQNLEVITNHSKPQHQHDHHHHHLLRSSLSSLAGNGDEPVAATEWFFDSSYGGGGGNNKSNGKNKESSTNGINATSSSFNNGGSQGWGDDQFHQFNGLV